MAHHGEIRGRGGSASLLESDWIVDHELEPPSWPVDQQRLRPRGPKVQGFWPRSKSSDAELMQ